MTPRKFAENGNLNPLLAFFDCFVGKLLANCPKHVCNKKTMLPFLSGSNKCFGFGHARVVVQKTLKKVKFFNKKWLKW